MFKYLAFATCVLSAITSVSSSPLLAGRATPDNTVFVASTTSYCMIVPRNPHTSIGASETTGGEQSYCSSPTDPSQGQIPSDFWSNVAFSNAPGQNGGRVAQLTGCIRPATLDRLDPTDFGGQYDSSGGDDGTGNPAGSVCTGYNHYVELIEPAGSRACIKCCDDPADCPLQFDTTGCETVIPGNYFNCAS